MNGTKNHVKIGIPDYVIIETETKRIVMDKGISEIQVEDISVEIKEEGEHQDIFLTANETPIRTIKFRWNRKMPRNVKIFGDVWERGYGDLEWRGMSANRFFPWYFLMSGADKKLGFGVKVRPSAMCFWQVDTSGVTLVMDVRCGGDGVCLNGRKLNVAQLVCLEMKGMSSFKAAQELCRAMCEDPVLPPFPVYGSNNWYYAYGDSSEVEILRDTDYILQLTEGAKNAPYMVIDDCWQEHHRLNEYNGGPWRCGNEKFPDMKKLADQLLEKKVRPGIWIRLLQNEDEAIEQEWRLPLNGCLDPSHPKALAYIKEDVRRVAKWGYSLIKHDFSTYDLFARWGFEMNPMVTKSGWHFYDRSKTSAEIVKQFYQAVYEAAKEYNAMILGCNTIGHLGAGWIHINRVGDDTSGHNWERTRRVGVNTLAFRLPQHKIFYEIDADCVGITGEIPWKLNKQWADVIEESGTPLFVSAKPGVLTEQEKEELHQIMLKASEQKKHKIPMDWEETDCPEVWADEQEELQYSWYEEQGIPLESEQEMYRIYIPMS